MEKEYHGTLISLRIHPTHHNSVLAYAELSPIDSDWWVWRQVTTTREGAAKLLPYVGEAVRFLAVGDDVAEITILELGKSD